jgi:hypothetical protein
MFYSMQININQTIIENKASFIRVNIQYFFYHICLVNCVQLKCLSRVSRLDALIQIRSLQMVQIYLNYLLSQFDKDVFDKNN